MMKTGILAGSVLFLAACTTVPSAFPPEAQAVKAKVLHERLSGKTYRAQLAGGMQWEMQYGADGYMSMSAGKATDKGRWRTEDNRLCVDFEGSFPSGCSEMRADSVRLYLKRLSTGEVVVLTPKP